MFGMSVGVVGVWAMSDVQVKCMSIQYIYIYIYKYSMYVYIYIYVCIYT